MTKQNDPFKKGIPVTDYSKSEHFQIGREIMEQFKTGKLKASRRYQRTFFENGAWSSQFIVSTINNSTKTFNKLFYHERPSNDNGVVYDLMDGLQRVSSYYWFLHGLEYPLGHKKHGTSERNFLKLAKRSIIKLPNSGVELNVSGMTHKQILAEFKKHGECYVDEYKGRFDQSLDVVIYQKLTESEVFSKFRDINKCNKMTDAQMRNAYGSDACEAIKILTIKNYEYQNGENKFHPIFTLHNNKCGYFSIPLKNESIQELCLRIAYMIENWDTDSFDLGSKKLDEIVTTCDDTPGSFNKKYPTLVPFLDFLYAVATNGKTIPSFQKNEVLFSDGKKNGKRICDYITIMWDLIIRKHKVTKNNNSMKYKISSDISNSKEIGTCSELKLYNWLMEMYKKLVTVSEVNDLSTIIPDSSGTIDIDLIKDGGHGLLKETQFRNDIRRNTICKIDFTIPLLPYFKGILKKIDAMNDSELSSIGLKRVDSQKSFTINQKAESWRTNPPTYNGQTISISNLDADHIIPHSLGGSTTAENLELIPPGENRSKGNKIV